MSDPEPSDTTASSDAPTSTDDTDTLWIRDSTTPDQTGPRFFHHYCALDPRDRHTGRRPLLVGYPETDTTHPTRLTQRIGIALTFIFRHAPLVVLVLGIGVSIAAALSPSVAGIEVLLPHSSTDLVGTLSVLLVVWFCIVFLLASLFDAAGPTTTNRRAAVIQLLHAGLVYGTGILLLGGTVYATFAVISDTIDPGRNIVFASGYLLLLFIGGPLVYDGMLRAETLFLNLDQTNLLDDTERAHAAYQEFTTRLERALTSAPYVIPTALLIGPLFVSQFAYAWLRGDGPFVLDFWPTLLLALGGDLLIVLIAVQFLILVYFMNKLLEDEQPEQMRPFGTGPTESADQSVLDPVNVELSLQYIPDHPDDAGGFRDFGRFSTRVNSLLILAGVYLAFRLHVQGARDPLGPYVGAGDTVIDSTLWVFSYVVPVVVYAAVIVIWLYFSFWQIHRKMVREKSRTIQREREHQSSLLNKISLIETMRAAPEWPINTRVLVTVISLDVISVLLSMASLI